MNDNVKNFLLTEYKASWDMILAIDNRRATFLNYYGLLFGGALTVTGSLLQRSHGDPGAATKIALVILLTATAIAGIAIIGVLRSERNANLRYRVRINRIRSIFATQCEGDLETRYFDIEKEHHPKGMGQTLRRNVFPMLMLQILLLTGCAIGLFLLES